MTITLSAIGVARGTSHEIETLVSEGVDANAIRLMRADGFDRFVRLEADMASLARETIERTLAASSIKPADIDAVIFSTESQWEREFAVLSGCEIPEYTRQREALLRTAFVQCGLVNAFPYAHGMSACANLASSLALASALVKAGRHRTVLVVLVERNPPDVPRLYARAGELILLMSDAAASFLVSSDLPGYRLLHTVTYSAGTMYRSTLDGDLLRQTAAWRFDARRFANKVHAETGRMLKDYPNLIADNLNSFFWSVTAGGLGIPTSMITMPTKQSSAHSFSIDGLLGLVHLQETGQLKPGTTSSTLNFGPWTLAFWSVAVD